MEVDLRQIAQSFRIDGELISIAPIKAGHINQTYRSEWGSGARTVRYIHQRINEQVFKDVPLLMRNVLRVTRHLQELRSQSKTEPGDVALEVVPARDERAWYKDELGGYWRTYYYIEDSRSFDVCPDAAHAYEAALTFGRFLRYLTLLDVSELQEPIPRFQDTNFRFEAFDEALRRDAKGRKASVRAEIDFALSQRATGMLIMDALQSGEVPLRVSHSDPKVNNVLFNTKTGRGFGVVDLDTCMPGTVLYDFGDLVRSTCCAAAEDEVDVAKVFMSQEYYQALAKGFMASFGAELTPREAELMPFAPRIIALTLGVRFLTDYLNGDTYFRIHRPQQNLDRTRVQFQLVRSMESQESAMRLALRP